MGEAGLPNTRNGAGRPRGNGRPDRFAALADPTRRQLLAALAAADRTVSELASGLRISQPAVSQHLKVLREAGLVAYCCTGRSHRYRVCVRSLGELRAWLMELELSDTARRAGHATPGVATRAAAPRVAAPDAAAPDAAAPDAAAPDAAAPRAAAPGAATRGAP